MGDYNRGNSRGGDSRGGNNRRDGERRELTLHDAVCKKCGDNCQVPFKPTGEKPVLCRDCFSKNKPRRDNDRHTTDNRIRTDRKEERRDNSGSMSHGRSEHYEMEFEKLNEKLDKILKFVTPVHTRSGIKKIVDMDVEEDDNQE